MNKTHDAFQKEAMKPFLVMKTKGNYAETNQNQIHLPIPL